MSKKVIILGWHFNICNCKLLYNDENLEWKTFQEDTNANILKYNSKNYIDLKKNNESYKIYIISYPKEDFVKNSGVNGKIKEIIGKNTMHEILLLLHKIPWKNEKEWNEDKEVKLVQKVFSTGKLYYSISDNPKGILDNKNNEECFTSTSIGELDWDFVWKEFYIGLSQKKNKLIQLWLPLAIDIQGLSEVEESNRNNYIKEIHSSNNKKSNYYKHLLADFWNMMVEQKFEIEEQKLKKNNSNKNEKILQSILKNIDIDIGLKKNLVDINKDSPLVKFINKIDEVCNNPGKRDDSFNKYITKSDDTFFFPDWLQKFTGKLEEIKI